MQIVDEFQSGAQLSVKKHWKNGLFLCSYRQNGTPLMGLVFFLSLFAHEPNGVCDHNEMPH